MAKQQFRFEPGSYGDTGNFVPSVACLKGSIETEWQYHFVLVKLGAYYPKEQDAVLDATKDLDDADEAKRRDGSDAAFANSLKSKGYVSVEGFNIVKE